MAAPNRIPHMICRAPLEIIPLRHLIGEDWAENEWRRGNRNLAGYKNQSVRP